MRVLMGMPAKDSRGGPIFCEPPFVDALRLADVEVDEEVYVHGDGGTPAGVGQRVRRVLDAALRLRRRIRESRYDIIHLNTSFDNRSLVRDLVTLRAMAGFGVPVFLKMHGSLVASLSTHNPAWIRLRGSLFSMTAGIGVLSTDERVNFINAGWPSGKLFSVTNAFEGGRLEPDPAFRARHGVAPDVPVLLFSARFVATKGLLDVIAACANLRDRGRDFVLFCLGDGPRRAEAEQLASELGLGQHIRFTGYIAEVEASIFHANSDIFVFPTFHDEGFPTVILKSLAAGLPIITTRIRAAADHLTEPDNCLWVEPRSPTELANAISRLLDDRAQCRRMSDNNRRLSERFSPTNVAREYLSIYESIVSSAGKDSESL